MTSPTHPRTACRSCAAPIIWAVSDTTGRPQPVDADPSAGGTIEMVARDPHMAPLARVVPAADRSDHSGHPRADMHLAHHATCPQASAWRQRTPRAGVSR